MSARLAELRTSLAAQLAELRGVPEGRLPAALVDIAVQRVELPGEDALLAFPRDWEALRHEEGAVGRPVPYWARAWPSGVELARWLAEEPPPAGARVLELGCGLGLPSIVAARAGAHVLATDASADAIAFAAHLLHLNGGTGEVGLVDWAEHGDTLVELGPWDLVLAADVLYVRANVELASRLLPRLVEPGGEIRLADPRRAGARDFLAAARASFELATTQHGEVALHRLTRRGRSVRRPPA